MQKNQTIKDIMASWPAHWPGESQQLDKDLLLMHTLKCDRAYLYTHRDQKLNLEQIKKIKSLFALREKGWPMAYILKEKEFYSLNFYVESGVFIPRPETETLVSAVLSYVEKQKDSQIHIMDLGCGTGCVGLSLLSHLPEAYLTGFDINPKAIKISHVNAKNLGLSTRATFIHQDVSTIAARSAREKTPKTKSTPCAKNSLSVLHSSPLFPLADIIVANPPYIAFKDPRVQKEVRLFEPPTALFAKEQGFACLKAWFQKAYHLLKPKGTYFFEKGADQDLSCLEQNTWHLHKKAEFKDLLGHHRVVQFYKN